MEEEEDEGRRRRGEGEARLRALRACAAALQLGEIGGGVLINELEMEREWETLLETR